MMVRDVVLLHLTGIAEQAALSRIPEVIIRMSDVRGFFRIKRTVALVLIRIRACHTVEDIAVVYPDVMVILLKAYAVSLVAVAVHKSDISDFEI